MVYFGSIVGHGKSVSRQGTKKSGFTFEGTCPDGKITVKMYNDTDKDRIAVILTAQDGTEHTICGSFNSLFEAITPKEA